MSKDNFVNDIFSNHFMDEEDAEFWIRFRLRSTQPNTKLENRLKERAIRILESPRLNNRKMAAMVFARIYKECVLESVMHIPEPNEIRGKCFDSHGRRTDIRAR